MIRIRTFVFFMLVALLCRLTRERGGVVQSKEYIKTKR